VYTYGISVHLNGFIVPTRNPRIIMTMNPYVAETISRLASLQGRSKGAVCAEIIESIHPPLMRTVALLEAARDAPAEVLSGLKTTVEDLEKDLAASMGTGVAQMDFLLKEISEEGAPEQSSAPRSAGAQSASSPHVVTRGSGLEKTAKTGEIDG
jgi:hypothetical protein